MLGPRAGSGNACRPLQPYNSDEHSHSGAHATFTPAWHGAALPASQGMSACATSRHVTRAHSHGAAEGQACRGGRAPVEVGEEQEEDDALHQQQQRRQPRPVARAHKQDVYALRAPASVSGCASATAARPDAPHAPHEKATPCCRAGGPRPVYTAGDAAPMLSRRTYAPCRAGWPRLGYEEQELQHLRLRDQRLHGRRAHAQAGCQVVPVPGQQLHF